ncbi:hypothetical protein PR202_gb11596 [Eleusine coracana subsp. coracana]|uniref:Uncharacterized protein n=1 Tax=Eleusine coracana subsp. coracana TaxID=191504 RepID=A0AAV5EKX3_ELECO|nr:hypothetical protein PR202_gb11596 [Eleusine coracana subsp. coracana]
MRTGRHIAGSCDCCGGVMPYCYCCISGGIPPAACGGGGGSMAYGELLERRAMGSRVTRRRRATRDGEKTRASACSAAKRNGGRWEKRRAGANGEEEDCMCWIRFRRVDQAEMEFQYQILNTEQFNLLLQALRKYLI